MVTSEKPPSVTYADGVTLVLPGDRVSVRLFLRRRQGEVIYVPGISKRRRLVMAGMLAAIVWLVRRVF
jgi:hypothetical protein